MPWKLGEGGLIVKCRSFAKRWLFAVGATVVAGGAPLPANAGVPDNALLIISKTDHVVEVRDVDSLALVGRIPVGPDPHEIEVAADGSTAYISNPGYGAYHEIDVIDLSTGTARAPIDTLPLLGPHGLALVGNRLWFTAQGSKAVARLNPEAGKIEWIMGTGQDTTHMIHVSTDGKHVYATNVGSGTVSILDNQMVPPAMPPTGVMPAGAQPRMDWVQTLVPVGQGAEGFDVSPDGRELWTVTPAGTISIVDTTARTVSARIQSGVDGAHRIKFTPDGRRVMLVSVKTGALAVYDAATRTLIKLMKTGRGAGIYMDADADRALVSCTPDNFVAVIDLKTLEEVARIPVGRPDGIAIAKRR
ncbi:hypothetical protein [Cupriavidus sp. TA19]|uniref:hypothetical protein n=1 Tax=Cupriavidus sp. TA19 TaxID=701108 RepID=UPI00295E619A|nr:hypothetical protein [Cupriavidus sp. TA19]